MGLWSIRNHLPLRMRTFVHIAKVQRTEGQVTRASGPRKEWSRNYQ
jgi:hypothetical protein